MKLYDIIKEFENLDEAGDVRRFLRELIKHYKMFHKPAKKFADDEIQIRLFLQL